MDRDAVTSPSVDVERRRVAVRRLGASVVAIALAGACASPTTSTPDHLVTIDRKHDVIVITNTTVFPATATSGFDRLVGFDVVVAGGKIVSLTPSRGRGVVVAAPRDAVVIDGTGKTLLPGLVDAHVHVSNTGAPPWRDSSVAISAAHNLEAYLYAGVTAVYDLGGDGDDLERLQIAVASGSIAGPRLFHTHYPITAPGGHPLPMIEAESDAPSSTFSAHLASSLAPIVVPQASGPADAERLVDDAIGHRADYLKLVRDALPTGAPVLSNETLAAFVKSAHAHDLPVFVHIGSADDALAASRAGADILAHGVYRGAITAEQARELAARKTKVVFTLASFTNAKALLEHRWQPNAFDRATVPADVVASIAGDASAPLDQMPSLKAILVDALASSALWSENVRTMRDAGVLIVPGSDSGVPGVYPGGSLHDDLHDLVDAGLSPSQVLRAATYDAAHLWLTDPDFGSVEPGKSADLILVDGDPFADIDAIDHIAVVVRAGHVVNRPNLRATTRERGARDMK